MTLFGLADGGCVGIGQDITDSDSPCYDFVTGPSAADNVRIAGIGVSCVEACCDQHSSAMQTIPFAIVCAPMSCVLDACSVVDSHRHLEHV